MRCQDRYCQNQTSSFCSFSFFLNLALGKNKQTKPTKQDVYVCLFTAMSRRGSPWLLKPVYVSQIYQISREISKFRYKNIVKSVTVWRETAMASVLAAYFGFNSQGMKGSPQYCDFLVAVILSLAGISCTTSLQEL